MEIGSYSILEGETVPVRKVGDWNVFGGERRAMAIEFALGMESMQSPELRERIALFFQGVEAAKKAKL